MSDADTIKAVTVRLVGLPPDPEGMNDKRAGWAQPAIDAFMKDTGSDLETVVADMIADLRHWCDRNGQDFNAELARALRYYEDETATFETEAP